MEIALLASIFANIVICAALVLYMNRSSNTLNSTVKSLSAFNIALSATDDRSKIVIGAKLAEDAALAREKMRMIEEQEKSREQKAEDSRPAPGMYVESFPPSLGA